MALTVCANVMLATAGGLSGRQTLTTAYAGEEAPVSAGFTVEKTFLQIGGQIHVVCPEEFGGTIMCYVGDDENGVPADDFILNPEDYEKWITVKAFEVESTEPVWSDRVYFSKLPVIYIDTENQQLPPPEDKSVKVAGTMFIQDNQRQDTPIYDGEITLQGRGNTTWQWEKKPYKIKLDSKTDLYGMGKSKKYVLLANYQDESLLRNTTAARISEVLGLTTMQTVWTDVIINGEYAGNYQLCEQVGIEKARVDIFDWEKEAEAAADAIAAANGFKKKQKTDLEDAMTENMSWFTTDRFTFEKTTYTVSDYYEYDRDITGGYLFESSEEFDEVSEFKTANDLKIMMKAPEFLATTDDKDESTDDMWTYVQQYWQDFENAYRSDDGYTICKVDGRHVHYTELADMDSMVSYWLLMEIMGNDDARYKSRYIYKPQGGKLTFGPPWDFDTGSGAILVRKDLPDGMSATGWKVSQFNDPQNFYRELLDDPLFIMKASEKYWQIRDYLQSVIKSGGQLDMDSDYLKESGLADAARWNREDHTEWAGFTDGYMDGTERFKMYLNDRISWLDKQFASENTLLNSVRSDSDETGSSASPYYRQDSQLLLSIADSTVNAQSGHAEADVTVQNFKDITLDISTFDITPATIDIYVNGLFVKTADAGSDKLSVDIPAYAFCNETGTKNIISVIARDADGNSITRSFLTLVAREAADLAPSFERHNLLLNGQIGVNFFADLNGLSPEERENCTMEFTVNGKTTTDTIDDTFMSQNGRFHGFTCYVNAADMADTITAVLHYGDGMNISETYSVMDYINAIDANADLFNETELALVHAIADYGHYVQPMLAATNNWEIGKAHAEMTKYYTDKYDYDAITAGISDYVRTFEKGGSDIEAVTNVLSLTDNTAIYYYIRTEEGYEGPVNVTLNGKKLKTTLMEDGRRSVFVSGIPAHKLGDAYTIKIKTTNGTATFSASALAYAQAILTSEKFAEDTATKDAVCALVRYYTTAMDYRRMNAST